MIVEGRSDSESVRVIVEARYSPNLSLSVPSGLAMSSIVNPPP